ncbi:Leu/Phe/Val dehydrogenase [Polycladidibacter stylochi]|uniref:Leu/Phe/Val dehydrogenase n=1 Tax=Polycladidibacter stylochi TaxID=1807766 RepID=UPI000836EB8E|nr:Glu/Leu/Phe/Val dehydrogenase dimerization domain-containing protein [Pseudovibrio stylochi]
MSANNSMVTSSQFLISPFEHEEFAHDTGQHENLLFIHCRKTGLKAIIAIHNTTLGPALGGCRYWHYDTSGAALTDALRLSKGMTYKNALANIPFGGGKAVILAQKDQPKTPQMLQAFGAHIGRLSGTYITAEDVGMSLADMDEIAKKTNHARGTTAAGIGDPSPYTATGVFEGIKAALNHCYGNPTLLNRTISIQGLGLVGYQLARLLHVAGAKLMVSDINAIATQKAHQEFGAKVIPPEQAHSALADVYAPCALGAVINSSSIGQIQAKIVAGSANNQLASDEYGQALHQKGIVYAPDYAINAGGVIAIATATKQTAKQEIEARLHSIGHTLSEIFTIAAKQNLPTNEVANQLAQERLENAAKQMDHAA